MYHQSDSGSIDSNTFLSVSVLKIKFNLYNSIDDTYMLYVLIHWFLLTFNYIYF